MGEEATCAVAKWQPPAFTPKRCAPATLGRAPGRARAAQRVRSSAHGVGRRMRAASQAGCVICDDGDECGGEEYHLPPRVRRGGETTQRGSFRGVNTSGVVVGRCVVVLKGGGVGVAREGCS